MTVSLTVVPAVQCRRLLHFRSHRSVLDGIPHIARVCPVPISTRAPFTHIRRSEFRFQWSTPRTEAFFLFVLGVLWLGEQCHIPSFSAGCSIFVSQPRHRGRRKSGRPSPHFLALIAPRSDIIGNIQCDALTSQAIPTKSGTRELDGSRYDCLSLTL